MSAGLYREECAYVAGAWVPATGDVQSLINPATGVPIGHLVLSGPREVAAAVDAAARALAGWSSTPLADRVAAVRRIGESVRAATNELGSLISAEVGTPIAWSRAVQAGGAAEMFLSTAEAAGSVAWVETVDNVEVSRTPVGVVGAITPWNMPLGQIAAKLAPALVAGCTIVVKASEVAPLNAFALARIVEQLSLPAGVVNILVGRGTDVGTALVAHPSVRMLSFTGSTRAGREVAAAAGHRLARCSLELGGKGAAVVLDGDDAALEVAVRSTVADAFRNSGQICTALSRLVVPRARMADIEAIARAASDEVHLGDPSSPEVTMGPVISASQKARVLSLIEQSVSDGALRISSATPDQAGPGYFVGPTVLSGVTPDMNIAQEEVFGPVLCLIAHDSPEEAVEIANNTSYGLVSRVFGNDRETAVSLARSIRAGQVYINEAFFSLDAPFGGIGDSGYGRENGRFGIEEFTDLRAVISPR